MVQFHCTSFVYPSGLSVCFAFLPFIVHILFNFYHFLDVFDGTVRTMGAPPMVVLGKIGRIGGLGEVWDFLDGDGVAGVTDWEVS